MENILRLSKTNSETINKFIKEYKSSTNKLSLLDKSKIDEFTNNLIIQILVNWARVFTDKELKQVLTKMGEPIKTSVLANITERKKYVDQLDKLNIIYRDYSEVISEQTYNYLKELINRNLLLNLPFENHSKLFYEYINLEI